jgi:hypothetical protein
MQIRLIWVLAMAFCLLHFSRPALAEAQNGPCEKPKDLQAEVLRTYPGTSLVTLSDLNDTNRESFQEEHRNECPGLVKVDFYGDGKQGEYSSAAVWSKGPGEYQDMCRNHRIRSTRPVIIFCRNFEWMILYAWKGNRVIKFSLAS